MPATKKTLRWIMLLWLAAVPAMAGLRPGHVLYADNDPAASYLRSPPGGKQALRRSINAALQKNPRNSVALSHRAQLFLAAGDVARANRDFTAAIDNAEPGSEQARNTLWSRGWASYDTGDTAAAIADWEHAVTLHGGHPYWATYTLALGYWTLGDTGAALAWYSAAVEANPAMGTQAGLEGRIRHWRATQQLQMRAAFAAWKAAMPAAR